jgi:hypothetical protein
MPLRHGRLRGGSWEAFSRSSARRRSNRMERYGYVIFLIAAAVGALVFAYLFTTAHY